MKKLMTLILIGTGFVCSFENANAQTENNAIGYYQEALLFSRTNPGGSARIIGVGGAQTALGGDISNIYSNPSGLGAFNNSQISITAGFNSYNNEAEYFNNYVNESGGNLSFNNLSIVISSPKNDSYSAWRGGSFGISYNRTNDFNNVFYYKGANPNNSIIDQFLESASGISSSALAGLTGMAYDTYLINPRYDGTGQVIDGQYDSFVLGLPTQEERVETRGSQGQYSFSYGGNVSDRFYFGFGLGVTSIRYDQTKTYSEYDFNDVDPGIDYLTIREQLFINGTGVNGTVGLMVRPVNFIRIGASFTSKTFYNLNEESSVLLEADYGGFYYAPEDITLEKEAVESDVIISNYNLTTPWRANGGVAIFLDKSGFITADVEYVKYQDASLSSSDFSTGGDNDAIKSLYTDAVNVRLGAELRLNIFRLRGGAAYYGTPYAQDDEFDLSRISYTLGGGLRVKNFYTDMAVVLSEGNNFTYSPYSFSDGAGPAANINNSKGRFIFTLGFNY